MTDCNIGAEIADDYQTVETLNERAFGGPAEACLVTGSAPQGGGIVSYHPEFDRV